MGDTPKCVETIYPQPKSERIWLKHSPSSFAIAIRESGLRVWVRVPSTAQYSQTLWFLETHCDKIPHAETINKVDN